MPTRMRHPDHGFTQASGAEVEWNKKNGWTVEAVADEVLPAENPEMSDAARLEDARQRYIETFGKPPHHRMGLNGILNALSN